MPKKKKVKKIERKIKAKIEQKKVSAKVIVKKKKRDIVAKMLWHEKNNKKLSFVSIDYKKIFSIAIPSIIFLVILGLIALVVSTNLKSKKIENENTELKTQLENSKKDANEEMSVLQKALNELKKKIDPAPEAADNVKKGFVEGSLFFPGTYIPKDIKVCAESIETKKQFCAEKQIEDSKYKNGVGYKIELPVGKYHVFSTIPAWTGYQAFYSDFVLCGMKDTCQSHNSIEVTVTEGQTTDGVDPNDWYNQKQ